MAEPDILYINDVANSLIIENSNQLNISNMSGFSKDIIEK